jgi:hypothetical protein
MQRIAVEDDASSGQAGLNLRGITACEAGQDHGRYLPAPGAARWRDRNAPPPRPFADPPTMACFPAAHVQLAMPAASSGIAWRSAGWALVTAARYLWLARAGRRRRTAKPRRACTLCPPIPKALPAPRSIRRTTSFRRRAVRSVGRLRLSRAQAVWGCPRRSRPPSRAPQGACGGSLMVQRTASGRLDLPHPLEPTMPISPGLMRRSAGSTKLLKPDGRRRLICIAGRPCRAAAWIRRARRKRKEVVGQSPDARQPPDMVSGRSAPARRTMRTTWVFSHRALIGKKASPRAGRQPLAVRPPNEPNRTHC